MKNLYITFFTVLSLTIISCGQSLERRPSLGVQFTELPATQRQQLGNVDGVLVVRVIPGSTASKINLKENDIITSINNEAVSSVDLALAKIRSIKTGQKFKIGFVRNGKATSIESSMQEFVRESSNQFDVFYGQVTSDGNVLRTIVTKPRKEGKFPVIFYVQGVGCGSVDFGADTTNSQAMLVRAFARENFVTLRVDKSGAGDSKGTPCEQLDFITETKGYTNGLKQILNENYVDTENIFLVGHSMGGVMAPLIAKEVKIKGMVTYGAITKTILEYLLESRRIQGELTNMDAESLENYLRLWSQAGAAYLFDKKPEEELARTTPGFREIQNGLNFRSRDFWQQLAATHILKAWTEYNGHILASWGSNDFIANKSDATTLFNTMKTFAADRAEYFEANNCTHELTVAQSLQDALSRSQKPFCSDFASKVLSWTRSKMSAQTENTSAGANSEKNPIKILETAGVENAYPHWSRDGSKILFQSNRTGKWQIFVMNRDGSNESRVTNDLYNNNFIDWSPDNKKIAFVSDRDGNEEIYIMNADGSEMERLTNNRNRDIHPYFSPDGKSILFNANTSPEGPLDIYQMNLATKKVRRLTNTTDEETCARFSPDMKKIVYLKNDYAAMNDEIYIMNPDGTNQENLTKSAAAEGWPCWSSDGSSIIFATNPKGRFALHEMSLNDRSIKQLTEPGAPFYDARPNLHAQSGDIVFNRQSGRTIGIYILKTR